jgi:hypothetical protein
VITVKLFDPGPKTYSHLLDRLNRRIDLRYRDYSTAVNFTLQPAPPVSDEHEQDVLFEAPALVEPPQKENLFSFDSLA